MMMRCSTSSGKTCSVVLVILSLAHGFMGFKTSGFIQNYRNRCTNSANMYEKSSFKHECGVDYK